MPTETETQQQPTATPPAAPPAAPAETPPTAAPPTTEQPATTTSSKSTEQESLLPRLESQQEVLDRLQADLDAREAERKAKEEEEAEAAAKAAEENEKQRRSTLSAKALLAEKEAEWEAKLADLQRQIAERDALAAKEKEYVELQQYQAQALAAAADEIAPELHDLVKGGSREEIDASVAAMKQKSAAIVASLQAAQTQARAAMRGTAPTGYGIGPEGAMGDVTTLTPEQIADMPMSEYAAWRMKQGRPGAPRPQNRGFIN
ncbi:hypothetical protein [Streptomyces rimosus]|uniref:hypothetical protein n=1 Tax=Streptomyces rimosus TaxID=1927 RepID=UPI0004CAA830|nr:hypothetical protein [Streptomyces rimosus]